MKLDACACVQIECGNFIDIVNNSENNGSCLSRSSKCHIGISIVSCLHFPLQTNHNQMNYHDVDHIGTFVCCKRRPKCDWLFSFEHVLFSLHSFLFCVCLQYVFWLSYWTSRWNEHSKNPIAYATTKNANCLFFEKNELLLKESLCVCVFFVVFVVLILRFQFPLRCRCS